MQTPDHVRADAHRGPVGLEWRCRCRALAGVHRGLAAHRRKDLPSPASGIAVIACQRPESAQSFNTALASPRRSALGSGRTVLGVLPWDAHAKTAVADSTGALTVTPSTAPRGTPPSPCCPSSDMTPEQGPGVFRRRRHRGNPESALARCLKDRESDSSHFRLRVQGQGCGPARIGRPDAGRAAHPRRQHPQGCGNQLRITAQLIDTQIRLRMCGPRPMTVHSRTSSRSRRKLPARSPSRCRYRWACGSDFAQPGMTRDVEAYDAYLQAQALWPMWTSPIQAGAALLRLLATGRGPGPEFRQRLVEDIAAGITARVPCPGLAGALARRDPRESASRMDDEIRGRLRPVRAPSWSRNSGCCPWSCTWLTRSLSSRGAVPRPPGNSQQLIGVGRRRRSGGDCPDGSEITNAVARFASKVGRPHGVSVAELERVPDIARPAA